MSEGTNPTHLLFAFLGGAIAGATAALLTAPKSGRETRDLIADYLKSNTGRVSQLPKAIRTASGAAKEAFQSALEIEASAEAEPEPEVKPPPAKKK